MNIIYFDFDLKIPFTRFFKEVFCKDWKITENKHLEVQANREGTLVKFHVHWDAKQDHAGFRFEIALLCLDLMISFYDIRHWDNEKNTWCVYD